MTGPKGMTRSAFLKRSMGLLGLTIFDGGQLAAALFRVPTAHEGLEHPDPRPGITAEHVLTSDALGDRSKEVLESYTAARTYPETFDGLACGCDCGGPSGYHRSLLSCYESLQPTGCHPCRTEAQLVAKLAKQGKSLADIRKAVDKKYQ